MNLYAGTFLIAFATLALEITLARLLSAITWYHLAFLAISTAMLGMTAGAVRVYLSEARFTRDRLVPELTLASLQFAASIPMSLTILCLLPLDLYSSVMTFLAFLVAVAACSLPFFFSGIAISLVLTKSPLPVERMYTSDLAGAALGCLFVLAGLRVLDAPSLILLCGGIGVLAALAYAGNSSGATWRKAMLGIFALAVVATFANAATSRGIRPLIVKGKIQPAYAYLMERWNTFSRVAVTSGHMAQPFYWGPSPIAPQDPVPRYDMNIDGEAGTSMQQFKTLADIESLRYDVTTVGYNLGRKGPACIIGVGGGRDVQSALLFGHSRVVAVELNPIFIEILEGPFREFAGLADRDDVQLVVDDARSYLSHTTERFSVIQMSMIDTWAATGAGAFTLSENALYTVEAWTTFMNRLTEDGILMVSRWHSPNQVRESGRAISLAVATLLGQGIEEPARHIAVITTRNLCTLILCKRPFDGTDVAKLTEAAKRLQYTIVHLPGATMDDAVMKPILLARTTDELRRITEAGEFNFTPPTDENPYFFNMLRLGNLGSAWVRNSAVALGNLTATITLLVLLLCLSVLAVATIVVPLLWGERRRGRAQAQGRISWSGATYFCLIGAGFMLAEIALMQRLSVFLGHPVYALGILLFTLIASTGLGSFVSERLPLTRRPWIVVLPLVAACMVMGLRFLLKPVIGAFITESIAVKIAITVAMVFPMGLVMGCFFPTGMKIARTSAPNETPWYWALNGIFGVLCSALAVFISIYVSISTNFHISAACYAATAIMLLRMCGDAADGQVPPE